MTQLRVGLTGGLAAGKSTVARLLAERGCHVVDADRLVAELYRPSGAGVEPVVKLFGEEVLDAEGGVDHGKLAGRIFADPEARHRLEAAIHPLVRRRFAELARRRAGIVVLEATLLVEAGYAEDFDLVLTVEADLDTRLERAVARGSERQDARRRLEAQGDGASRLAAADRVIVNDGSLKELEAKVDELTVELERLLAERSRKSASSSGGSAGHRNGERTTE